MEFTCGHRRLRLIQGDIIHHDAQAIVCTTDHTFRQGGRQDNCTSNSWSDALLEMLNTIERLLSLLTRNNSQGTKANLGIEENLFNYVSLES